MTTEVNLHLVWGSNETGLTDPTDAKWALGWLSEIPTYQHFNYLLNAIDRNILVLAEKGAWAWNSAILYEKGAVVKDGGVQYYCRLAHTNQQPSLDTSENYWLQAPAFGTTTASSKWGLQVKAVNSRGNTTWGGNDLTLLNNSALLGLYTYGFNNWLVGNIQGSLAVVDLVLDSTPDVRSIALTDPAVHKIFHEGNEPLVSQVVAAVEEAPDDGKLYAREGLTATSGQWVQVTSTTVSDEPPPAVSGAGRGWYNLHDGQFYIDIDDGDSHQWVPANPPFSPEEVFYDNTTSGLTATTMQAAIDELAALHP